MLKKLLQNNIIKSSAGLLIITLLVKVLGYAEKLVLAYYYGTSYEVDVYTVILTIVLSLFYFSREVIEPGFLNVFLEAKSKGDESGAWHLFNKGIRIILAITIPVALLVFLFPESIMNIFAPGFNGDKWVLSVKLLQIAVPAFIFLALSTLTSITLNGIKLFVLTASGELAFKGFFLLGIVVFYRELGIVGAILGIIAGSIGRFAVHLVKLFDKISFRKASVDKNYARKIWILTWPLLLGVSFSQVSSLVDNIFASYLQEGAIAALSYAKKVVELPIIIFPYVLSIVVFPYFSKLAIEKKQEKLKKLLADSLKWIVIAFLPIASFFFVYSTSIVEIIFQHGAFDRNSTLLTSKPLMVYSLGMVFFAIETILVIFYYTNADAKTPVFVGIGCVLLHIVLTWIFIGWIGYIGIAIAFVIQKTVKNLVLLSLLKNKITFDVKKIGSFLFKVAFSVSVFTLVIFFSRAFMDNWSNMGLLIKMTYIGTSFVVGSFVYLIGLRFAGVFK